MSRYNTSRENVPHTTWINSAILAPAKYLSGKLAFDHVEKYGSDGWYRESNQKRISDRIRDQMPFVLQEFDKMNKSKYTFGEAIARRAMFCLPPSLHRNGKNEIQRFTIGDLNAITDLMDKLKENPSMTIILDHILEAQEKQIITTVVGPCTYIRWRPDNPNEIYWGSSSSLTSRNKQHSNSTLPLYKAFPWATLSVAQQIENAIHHKLKHDCIYQKEGTRGRYVMPYDDAPKQIDLVVKQYYNLWMHGTVTGDLEINASTI